MATRRSKKANGSSSNPFNIDTAQQGAAPLEPRYTGRFIVLLAEGGEATAQKTLARAAGLKHVASADDFKSSELSADVAAGADALYLPEIGVMVVDGDSDRVAAVAALEDATSGIEAKEPEQICYALQDAGTFSVTADYARGFRDGVSRFSDTLLRGPAAEADMEALAWSELQFTWGLQATLVHSSRQSGKSARVAVLDTGMDLRHPDFAGRRIVGTSFVSGQTVQDGHGHGTHCIGTACGPQKPGQPPRYGIAFDAQIFAGKVLSNAGSGGDAGILAGINWAVANQCQVISMSLGAPVRPGETFSPVYEGVAKRALQRGSLIVAAAGNESRSPVGRPANCPSIMAVSALDKQLQLASFSNIGVNPNGGQIDIAAPGVDVLSSVPMPRRYARFQGTSMATPHVAGIAALHFQATRATGSALWRVLVTTARRLALPSAHVGAGIVQAPR
jgi:subtilisin family serine protease